MPKEPNLLGSRALVEYSVGDFEAGKPYLEQLLEIQQSQSEVPLLFPGVGVWTVPLVVIPLVARIAEVPDCFDILEAAARSIIASPSLYPAPLQGARIGLVLMAIHRGDGEAAKE